MLDNLHVDALRHIGLKPALLHRAASLFDLDHHDDKDLHDAPDTPDTPSPVRLMRVTELHREHLLLHDGALEHRARAHPSLIQALLAEHDALAVGDWVLAGTNALAECWVQQRVPPLNQMARRLHDGRDKVTRLVIVANVDTALLVMGLDADFNLRRLERYLAAVRLAGIEPLVVLTKADLCPQVDERLRAVRAILPAGTELLAVNATDDAATRAALSGWTGPGQTLVLMGSSGAGKSTLTNALVGAEVQRTQANRADDSRGRHTTTARSLHRLAAGGCIIDTPGLRTLRLDGDSGQVQPVFDDIARLAAQCRFRDCRHQGEPGCAVQGAVDEARLRNFHKLRREAERDQMSALERKAQAAVWKVRAKAARERARDKR